MSVILEKGGNARHVLSLRRRDGKVRHFALICHTITAMTGDDAGTIEGFLLDRELEEQIARAERESEYAKKQRSSLALLLAATCRQTQSYFTPPQHVLDRACRDENAANGQDKPAADRQPGAAERQNGTQQAWPAFVSLGVAADQPLQDEWDEQEEGRRERLL